MLFTSLGRSNTYLLKVLNLCIILYVCTSIDLFIINGQDLYVTGRLDREASPQYMVNVRATNDETGYCPNESGELAGHVLYSIYAFHLYTYVHIFKYIYCK